MSQRNYTQAVVKHTVSDFIDKSDSYFPFLPSGYGHHILSLRCLRFFRQIFRQRKFILDDFIHHRSHLQIDGWVVVQHIKECRPRLFDLGLERVESQLKLYRLRVRELGPCISSYS